MPCDAHVDDAVVQARIDIHVASFDAVDPAAALEYSQKQTADTVSRFCAAWDETVWI